MGGNSTHHYQRHEDDEQQQQKIIIHRDFRLVYGQLDLTSELTQRKRLSLTSKKAPRHRKISASTDQQFASVSLIILEIPTSPFDSNDLDIPTFRRTLLDQDLYGKELSHLFRFPSMTEGKSSMKTLPTVKLAAVYYEQALMTGDLTIDPLPYLDEKEIESKFDQFKDKTILTTYTSKSTIYLISTKNPSKNSEYVCVRSTMIWKTALENFEWFQVLIDYSHRGYRLCGVIPLFQRTSDTSLMIYWLFERMEKLQYDCCILSNASLSFYNTDCLPFLNSMSKQEWKLASTLEYPSNKKTREQYSYFLFFQKSSQN